MPIFFMCSKQNLRLYHIYGCKVGPRSLHALQNSKTVAFLKDADREDLVFKEVSSFFCI